MFPEFAGVLQDAYVKVASAELRASSNAVSADAIFVMTEVDTPRVQELIDLPDAVNLSDADERINAATRLLLGWHTDRDYIGPYGLVRDLAFSTSDHDSRKGISGFADLAQQYCPGVPPKVLLDELIRTGCVQDLGNGFYRAVTRSYVPEQLSAESLRRFAQVVHNVIETLEVNLRRTVRGTGRVERLVYVRHFPRSSLPAFDRYLRQRGQLFADDIDNWLSDHSEEGHPDAIETGIGFYHYVVNTEDEKDFGKALQKGE